MSQKQLRPTSASGFTLIEILVVIVILGILGAVVVPQLLSRPDTARVQAAQTDLRTLSAALDVYRLDNFNYPSSEQGLEALVQSRLVFLNRKTGTPMATSKSCQLTLGVRLTSMSVSTVKLVFTALELTGRKAATASPQTSNLETSRAFRALRSASVTALIRYAR